MADAPQLRLYGYVTLVCGLLLAAIVFLWQSQASTLADGTGFTRGQEHQMKMLMGPLAVAMSGWADALTSPAGEAIVIAVFAAFVAYMCFRHARFQEEEEHALLVSGEEREHGQDQGHPARGEPRQ